MIKRKPTYPAYTHVATWIIPLKHHNIMAGIYSHEGDIKGHFSYEHVTYMLVIHAVPYHNTIHLMECCLVLNTCAKQ